MSETGYVRMHRSLLGHAAFRNDAEAMTFAWMILRASWRPTRVRYKGQAVSLARGELCISLRDLAEAMDRDKMWVSRLLKRLTNETMIETRTETAATIITICNYDEYQADRDSGETASETRPDAAARQGRDTEQGKEKGKKEEGEDADASPPARRRAAVGTKISPDWKPSPLPPTVAELTAQWPPGREKREEDAFRDYWLSRSRDASRANWDRAWHSRIRDIHDRIMAIAARTARNDRQSANDDGIADPLARAAARRQAGRAAEERGHAGSWADHSR